MLRASGWARHSWEYMPRRRKAKALLDVQATGSGLSVNTVQREVQVKGGIRDLESHCARLQALCNQVQASLEYVTAENEQLRLALAPADIEPEPIRISVQVGKAHALSHTHAHLHHTYISLCLPLRRHTRHARDTHKCTHHACCACTTQEAHAVLLCGSAAC